MLNEGMPLWGPNRFWPGSGLVLRCLGPGFTVLALGPGFRPIFIHSMLGRCVYGPHTFGGTLNAFCYYSDLRIYSTELLKPTIIYLFLTMIFICFLR